MTVRHVAASLGGLALITSIVLLSLVG